MKRSGFTLIELLVVISIMVVLAAMMVLVWPKQQPELDGTVRLQGWLVEARSKALRDQRPVGLRVLNGVPMFIEQPDNWRGASDFITVTNDGTTVTVTGDFSGSNAQAKDMLAFNNGMAVILTANNTTLTCVLPPGATDQYWRGITNSWCIIRQPVGQVGAMPLSWPNATLTPDQDVMFAPSGMLIGVGVPVRWIVGGAYVVQVQPMTGQVAVHPVAPGPDPYLFTRDGKSSGF